MPMNRMMEELCKLESVDAAESRSSVTRLKRRLRASRDPALLGELVDFYFATGSKRAMDVLTNLREAYSQDFFDKLNECIHKTSTRLAVLRLLACMLNLQASWLYRVVEHVLFTSILHYLQTSGDVVVLTSSLLVVCAMLPLVPSYISHHLSDLFEIFTQLATIRSTSRLGLTPRELYLHLDVAVYYFFLQLYALFPCNLSTYLRGRYGPTGEVYEFQEYIAAVPPPHVFADAYVEGECLRDLVTCDDIRLLRLGIAPRVFALCLPDITECDQISQAFLLHICILQVIKDWRWKQPGNEPLFHHVQLHPSLVTDDSRYETTKPKWGAMEPHDIATLSLHMCLDPAIAVQGEETVLPSNEPLSGIPSSGVPQSSVPLSGIPSSGVPLAPHELKDDSGHEVRHSEPSAVRATENRAALGSRAEALQWKSIPNPSGFKSAQELTEFWSPSIVFGQITPREVSSESSRMSLTPHPHPLSLHASNFSSPLSDSAMSSTQHTPGPTTNTSAFTFKNYSPTASVDGGDPLLVRQPSSITHSAIHTPSVLEESLGSAPLSQSLQVESTHRSASSTRAGSPVKMAAASRGSLNQSLKTRFERFIDLFSPRKRSGRLESQSSESEDFTEIFTSDVENVNQQRAEVGEECSAEVQQHEAVEEEEEEDLLRGEGEGELSDDGSNSGTSEEEKGDDVTTPCVDKLFELTLGVHRDLRRFSHIGAVHHGGEVDAREGPYSSSFPGRSPAGRLRDRKHTSHSETGTTQTVLQLQERLQRLVESTDTIADDVQNGTAKMKDCDEVLSPRRPTLHTLASTDSTSTLLGSSPQGGGGGGGREEERRASQLLMRRVSVCSRRRRELVSPGAIAVENESPVALLDQFVQRGEMLHRGQAEDILLTELEDVDWSYFVGCPHSEELGVMHSQVALLHSQLLFERYQCLQHARRNRRLLSRARTTTQVMEQLLSLHDQLRQQNQIISSLEEELHRSSAKQGPSRAEEKLRSENRVLCAENSHLRDNNLRLTAELQRVTQQNGDLSEELKHAGEQLFALEKEREQLQPKLTRASQLQNEVEYLSREVQVLGELYHTQREQTLALLCQGGRGKEGGAQREALRREKEAAERNMLLLRQELECVRESMLEQQLLVVQKEKEVTALHQLLGRVQGACQEKIMAVENKYHSLRVSTQQLEALVMELKGRSPHRRRTHVHRHRRCNSHPTGQTSLTPSPSLLHPSSHTPPIS